MDLTSENQGRIPESPTLQIAIAIKIDQEGHHVCSREISEIICISANINHFLWRLYCCGMGETEYTKIVLILGATDSLGRGLS